MKRPCLCILIGSVLFMAVCSCGAKTAVISQKRFSKTDIHAQEGIVVFLNVYKEGFYKYSQTEEKERELERCIDSGLKQENSQLRILSANDLRQSLFPGVVYRDAPRDSGSILKMLADENIRKRLEINGLRFIVTVDMVTFETGKTEYSPTWSRQSNFQAYILDAKLLVKSGELYSTSSGVVGYLSLSQGPVPYPLIPLFAMTESEACTALGRAIHKFIVSNEEPAPVDDKISSDVDISETDVQKVESTGNLDTEAP